MKPITVEWINILPTEPSWLVLHLHLSLLDKFSMLYRYPGNDALKDDARQAIQECREVRRFIRTGFGLSL